MPLNAREIALKSLIAMRRDSAWSDKALNKIIGAEVPDAKDLALASQITNGVLQNRTLCDYYIRLYSSVPLRKIEPQILDILRISFYQIICLTKIPHSAAVNEGVKLAKKYSHQRAASYVNAVLRKLAANAGSLPKIKADSDAERLSIEFSHPLWLTEAFVQRLGYDEAAALLTANNALSIPITAQVNTLKYTMDEVRDLLRADGIEAEVHGFLTDCLLLTGAGNIAELRAFKKGAFYVQDAAARLSVIASGVCAGDTVIDCCAAPGGKSFTTAVAMKNRGRIIALDKYENKLRFIKEGASRLGIDIIEAFAHDSSQFYEEFSGLADVVIADVPCSGTGVIRKKPEIRYKAFEDIAGLPEIQKSILQNAASYVKPGGILLYSTCSLLKMENEDVIAEFLNNNSSFALAKAELPKSFDKDFSGEATLWPQRDDTDGFFICKMRRKNAN